MSGFNAKRLGSYGQTNYVVGMGRNRCAVGSITREYNYLERTNKAPFCALFDFNCPNNPPPPKPTVPSAPSIVSATPFDTLIDIYFTQPSNGGSPITNYEYFLLDASGASWTPFSPPVTTSPVEVTGLISGQTYNIQIRAVNAIGAGPASATVTETTLAVPEEPTDLSAIAGDTSIQITFTLPYDGGSSITNYEYSLNGGSSWSPFSPAVTSSPVTITGLTNGTVYNIKLRAINDVGTGVASSQISIAPIPSNSFDPADIAGINLWLDGQYPSSIDVSSNIVTTWNDRSGENNNFSYGGAGTVTYAQPSGINNRPAIYFETSYPITPTYLSKSFNIAPTSNQFSLFVIAYQAAKGASGNSELFFTRNDYRYFDLFNNTNSTGILSINIGNGIQVSTGLNIIGPPPTIALIDVIATGTADVYVNGTQTNNNVTRGGLSLDTSLNWAISGGAFQGYVGEIIAYPSGLSDSDRQKVEGYLAWKWGIQDQLPNSQPYKNAPPIALAAPVITGITGSPQTLSVAFTQTSGGATITNYQYSTDNGATFRELATPDITSPLTITTLSSDGTTSLTNGVTYDVIIQAKTANGLSPVSNMEQGTPDPTVILEFTTVGSTNWIAPAGVTSVEYLVVGGGGGSGATHDGGGAGGGGGGMVLTGTLSVNPGDIYSIVVGDGGAGGIGLPSPSTRETDGSSGDSSEFSSILALGGGGGYRSRNNGSGTGGSAVTDPSTASIGGYGGSFSNGGGGGGGDSGTGSNGVVGAPRTGGAGGSGTSNSISGSSITYGRGGNGGNAQTADNAEAGANNTGNGASGPGTPFSSQRSGAKGGSGIVILKYTPAPPDAIVDSLTTSLAAYNAAATDDWVKITSTEYANLQTNISGTAKVGISDAYLTAAAASGLTVTDQSAIVANTATANTPAIPSNSYLYAFAIKYGNNLQATDMRVFTNTSTTSFTGFNQVGSVLPPTTTDLSGFSINYYVRKGVSATNGSTPGILSVFSGQTASSATRLGFYQNFSVNNSMRYLLFTPGATGGAPNSSSVVSGSLANYGAFAIQGLTTDTIQWN